MTAPSAFADSPEDLVQRVKLVLKDEVVPAPAAVLLTDLARAVERERSDRAARFSQMKETLITMGRLESEVKSLKAEVAETAWTRRRPVLFGALWATVIVLVAVAGEAAMVLSHHGCP